MFKVCRKNVKMQFSNSHPQLSHRNDGAVHEFTPGLKTPSFQKDLKYLV